MRRNLVLLLLFIAIPLCALAQTVARGAIIEITTEIVAIDHDARLITLEDEDGDIEEIYAGPEVMRFDELKVGDEVNFARVPHPQARGSRATRFGRGGARPRHWREAIGCDRGADVCHGDDHGDGQRRAVGND